MRWVSLKTKHLRQAAYDADRQLLFIRTSSGSVRRHTDILPHMFENLVSSDDPSFYYRYYIEPSRVSEPRPKASRVGHLLKVGVVVAGVLLLSAPGLVF